MKNMINNLNKSLIGLKSARAGAVFVGLVWPQEYFENQKRPGKTIVEVLLILIVCGIILAITRFLGPEDPLPVNSTDMLRLAQRTGPLGRLLFPVQWAVLIFAFACARYVVFLILGFSNRNFGKICLVSSLGCLPIALCGGLIGGVLNNFLPVTFVSGGSFAFSWNTIFHLCLLFIGILWELYIWMNGGQHEFELGAGRGALVFLTPYAGCCLPLGLFLFFISMHS